MQKMHNATDGMQYDSMDGGGRATLGAKAESNAGAVTEELFSATPYFIQSPCSTDFSRLNATFSLSVTC